MAPACTLVTASVDAGGGLLALLTKPEQPLRSAAEQLRIMTPSTHTRPFALVFTFLTFLWA